MAGLALELPFDPLDAIFEGGEAGKGGPLEGGKGFGHEGVEAEGDAGQAGAAGSGFGDGMLQVFGQAGDVVDVGPGFGGQPQEKIEAELGEAGGMHGDDGLLQVGGR